MSKVLLINGSPRQHGCTDTALRELAGALERNGVESEIFWLGNQPVQDCIACCGCQKAGKCVFDDGVNQVAARLDEFDGLVVGSPVYYGGPTGRLTSFLDRLFFSADKAKLAGKLAASVVSCRRGGSTGSFQRLNQFFLMTNMTVVGSQYWNQVHGSNPEDVAQDAEGLQTMRTLGENMAYLLAAQKAARDAGVSLPTHETPLRTNFIS